MLYLLRNSVYLKSCIYITKNTRKLTYGNKLSFLGFKINLIFVEDVFNLREETRLVAKTAIYDEMVNTYLNQQLKKYD